MFSLGSQQLDKAIAYVRNQKVHYLPGTTILSLKRDSEQEDDSIKK